MAIQAFSQFWKTPTIIWKTPTIILTKFHLVNNQFKFLKQLNSGFFAKVLYHTEIHFKQIDAFALLLNERLKKTQKSQENSPG